MRRWLVLLVAAAVVGAFASPGLAARAAKPTKGEQKLCDLLKDSAGVDNTVQVDAPLAQAIGKAAGRTKNKKMVKNARPLASLVKKREQVGLQIQTLIAECERRGAEPRPLVPAPPTGFAVDSAGSLYSLDMGTGVATLVGPTGIAAADVEGLAVACDGTLYAIDRTSSSLFALNRSTGAASKVGTAGLGVEPADAGLTQSNDGRLFMADVNSGNFFEVDPETGVAQVVGPMGSAVEISGLATRADGTIFAFDRAHDQLVTIDPDTGVATIVGPTGFGHNLVGLDFDALDVLRGVDNKIEDGAVDVNQATTFVLDPATGAGADGPNTTPLAFKDLAIGAEGCAGKKAKNK